MKKRIVAFLLAFALVFIFVGCNTTETTQSSNNDVEVIIEEIIEESDKTVSNESNVNSNVSEENESVNSPASSQESVISSQVSSNPSTSDDEEEVENIDFEWKKHAEDYKLIALTFDDGPSDNMLKYVQLLSYYEGAGTFFVNGYKIKGDAEYRWMQTAIDRGWDIGNHGDKHLVATIGGANGGEVTYDELRADIDNLTHKLESHLVNRDGTPYEVSIYRAPNIKPTANTFKICDEEKFPVIWLAYDALDWDTTKTDKHREDVFKYGVGEWEDGDVILCHEVQQYADQTYKYLEQYLPDFYRKGYRFCSITELMELRGITREQICGELKNVDGNRGMVTNIVKAAKQGKK